MKEIFLCVLSLSASGALTGLLLLIIRPFTLKFLSKKWNYYIWILVVAYLILPIRLKVFDLPTFSAGETMTWPVSDTSAQEIPENAERQALKSWEDTGLWESNQSDYENQLTGKATDWIEIAAEVWLLGMTVIFGMKLRDYGKFSKSLRTMSWPVADEQIIELVGSLSAKLAMKKKPGIYESPVVSGPITLGLCHPMVILPKEEYDLSKLSLVLHHEMVHIKRKDLWYKWLYQILLCVHWFNHVLYLVEKKVNIDCELSCDEAILVKLTEEGKRAYGNILLNVAGKNVDFRKSIFSTTLLERKEDLKERLKGIIEYKKQSGFKVLLSLCIFTGVLFLSACGAQITSDGVPYTLENPFEELFEDMSVDAWSKAPTHMIKEEGWEVYDDDKLLLGDDICDHWQAYCYSGGEKLDCKGFFISGCDSILIVHATDETEIQVSASYELLDGKFKLVCISPDGEVTVIEEKGEGDKQDITLKEGRNVIKMVGQGASLKNLKVRYYGLDAGTIENIYYSEEGEYAEYAEEAFESGEKVSKEKVMDVLPYMEDEAVSKAFAALLCQGEVFSEDELCDIFIYSDADLSSHYLLKAIADGQTEPVSAEAFSEIIPYLNETARTEIILTMGENLTFDDLNDWAPYLSSEQLERCLVSYLEVGNTLTYSQFNEISPYLNAQSIKNLDELIQK